MRHSRTLRSGERGAAATIVAVLATVGVLLGMLAISVDVGNVMLERRQVQNAADATALALAEICATDEADCTDAAGSDTRNTLDDYSGYNAMASQVMDVCGRGVPLDACDSITTDAPISELTECPALPDWLKGAAIPFVETYAAGTATHRFLSSGESSDVQSCARAAWGTPASASVAAPITISACEWERDTEEGDTYWHGPEYQSGTPGGVSNPGYGAHNPWPTDVLRIKVRSNSGSGDDYGSEECHTSPSGVSDAPGGFGFLSTAGGCTPEVSQGWIRNENGSNLPNACRAGFAARLGTVIGIPVYNCIVLRNPSGTLPSSPPPATLPCDATDGHGSPVYHLAGFAKFYLSGYGLPGMGTPGVPNSTTCPSGTSCLRGWFVTGTLETEGEILPPGGPTDFGVFVIRPAG